MKKFNIALFKKYNGLQLVKGEGYFYFVADTNNELALKLAELFSTSVYVKHFNQMTIEQWNQEADNIINQTEKL